jgi:16S rRNA C967 or C1407 C5-methylase (RsmB/RsmF family)
MTQEKVTSNYKKAALENFLKKYLKKLKKPPEEDKKYFKSVHSRKHPEELFKELPKEYTIDIKFKSRRLPEPYYNKDRDGSQGVIHFSIAITGAILLQIIYSYL